MRVTAAVVRRKGGPFGLEDLELDEPRADEVRVRIAGAGICHTDLSVRDQAIPMPLPAVLGHEGAGTVEAVGAGVRSVAPGDTVILSQASCGACPTCLGGEPSYCVNAGRLGLGGTRGDGSRTLTDDGEDISGNFVGQSSFATHALAAERNIVRVTSDLPIRMLGPLGCGVQTGAGAVMNDLCPSPGKSLVVFGAGSVGLSAVMAARAMGCSRVVAVDRVASRLDLALELGATDVVGGEGESDLAGAVRDLIDGGADFSVEAAGVPSLARAAVDCLNNRGTCGLIGAAPYGTTLELDWVRVMGGRGIRGIIMGSCVPQVFLPALLELHRQGRFPFDRMIRYYPFADIEKAVADMASGAVLKPVLEMA